MVGLLANVNNLLYASIFRLGAQITNGFTQNYYILKICIVKLNEIIFVFQLMTSILGNFPITIRYKFLLLNYNREYSENISIRHRIYRCSEITLVEVERAVKEKLKI